MAKHTSGPWVASCDDDDAEAANEIRSGSILVCTVNDDKQIIAKHRRRRVEGPGSQAGPDALDEVDANARLIAAAPDLLAAASQVMRLLEEHGPSIVPHLLDNDDNAGQRLREAIAKAEGTK